MPRDHAVALPMPERRTRSAPEGDYRYSVMPASANPEGERAYRPDGTLSSLPAMSILTKSERWTSGRRSTVAMLTWPSTPTPTRSVGSSSIHSWRYLPTGAGPFRDPRTLRMVCRVLQVPADGKIVDCRDQGAATNEVMRNRRGPWCTVVRENPVGRTNAPTRTLPVGADIAGVFPGGLPPGAGVAAAGWFLRAIRYDIECRAQAASSRECDAEQRDHVFDSPCRSPRAEMPRSPVSAGA